MRRPVVRGAIFAVTLAALVSTLVVNHEARGQTTVTVNVGDIYFCDPSFANGICETTIIAGDTVMWNWVSSATHTVTQCDPAFTLCPPPGGFDSGMLTGSGQMFSQPFNTPGTFPYQCNVHGAGMRGRVIVGAVQATPTTTAAATAPAQTGTAGPTSAAATTVVATATRAAAVPAAVPGTGGSDGESNLSWPLVLAIAGSLLVAGSAGVGAVLSRRR